MQQLTNGSQLREQAQRFRAAATKLIEVAEILDGTNVGGNKDSSALDSGRQPANNATNPHKKTGKRLTQIRDFLKAKGPSLRKDVIAGVNMPAATVAYILKEENGFKRDENRRWSVPAGE